MELALHSRSMRRRLAVATLVWMPCALAAHPDEPFGLPLSGEAAEAFLRDARVTDKKTLSVGITRSQRYSLTDGTRKSRALWKTIDESKPGVTNFQGGGFVVDFSDSWKHEVASYELDKLVGTGLVPPTIERTIDHVTGSLQLWVEKAKTEADRKQERINPPDVEAWNRQMYGVRLLHQLTFNTDARNIRNVLFDPTFRVYAVDFSRAFAPYADLRSEKELERFPRSALERLRALDRALLFEKLGRWLNGRQIDTMLKRRDKILAIAERLAAEHGEDRVFY
jgi:hypothetical protein